VGPVTGSVSETSWQVEKGKEKGTEWKTPKGWGQFVAALADLIGKNDGQRNDGVSDRVG